jgi:3-keto-5-aminohexanoate cleavage enzyme
MASLDMGPLNRYRRLASEHTRATIDTLCETIADRGIKPELEVFNDGHLNEVAGLLDGYDLDVPVCVICFSGAAHSSPPRHATCCTSSITSPMARSSTPLPSAVTSFRSRPWASSSGPRSCRPRRNVYYPEAELATSNAQVVERAVTIADWLERPVTTPTEVRSILGLWVRRRPRSRCRPERPPVRRRLAR